MRAIHRQVDLQLRIGLLEDRLLDLLLSDDVLRVEFFNQLPLIRIRSCLQHFHVGRELRALLHQTR